MIGIIGAMSVEIQGIQARIENPVVRKISGHTFVSGKLCGRDVVAAECGIGKVNAAICAQTMILTYAPELMINSGVGGSLTKTLTFGDIAIADKLVQHDVDTSALGDPVGLVSTINKIYFESDPRAVQVISEAVSEMEGVSGKIGTIASGDQFIASGERKRWITEQFGAVACEMEGGAIAQVCDVAGVKFVVIRAISDNADDDSNMDYGQFVQMAAERSIHALLKMLERY